MIMHLNDSTFLMKLRVLYRVIIVFQTFDRNQECFVGNYEISSFVRENPYTKTDYKISSFLRLNDSTFLMTVICLCSAIIVFETADRNQRSSAGNHRISSMLMPGKFI